ncbi:hypothetical protein ACWGBY_29550 [Streptomyces griseus]
MTVEVTSRDADTNRRDRVEKPDGYAAAGSACGIRDGYPGAVVARCC